MQGIARHNFKEPAPFVLASGDADVQKWVLAGGTKSQPVVDIVTAAVSSLKSINAWVAIDDLIFHATDNRNSAGVWIKSSSALTEVNSPTWTQFVGYTGDGAAASLNYNVNPGTLTNYTQNSGHLGVYVQTAESTSVGFKCYAGSVAAASGNGPNIGQEGGSQFCWTAMNGSSSASLNATSGSRPTGYLSAERTSGSAGGVSLYVNSDVANVTGGPSSAAIFNGNLFGLAQNAGGSASIFTNGTLSAVVIGASGLQALGVRSIITTAVTALLAL